MKPENKAILDRLRKHRATQKAAQFIGQIQMEERNELLRITREEFDPNYRACLTCPEDLYQLVNFVYGQEEQQDDKATQETAGLVHLTFPKQEPEQDAVVPDAGPVEVKEVAAPIVSDEPKKNTLKKNKNETESKP